MKKIFLLLLTCIFLSQMIRSQTILSQGKPIIEIFSDFHINLKDTAKTTGFGLERTYLGYTLPVGNNFSATLILNTGSQNDLSSESVKHRYAYFKYAYVSWTNDKLNLSFGIASTHLSDYQEIFWGKRYVAETFLSARGYGSNSDLGVVLDYTFNNVWKIDLTLMNGRGYPKPQLDNSVKTSVGLTITPDKKLAFRLYSNLSRTLGIWQYTLIGFTGYKNDRITIGAEASYISSLDHIAGHNAWGLSGTGAITVTKKKEIFIRYDYSSSVKGPDDIIQWNYLSDGSFFIAGLQHTFNQYVKIALNYQNMIPYYHGFQNSDLIFLNTSFKF